MSNSAWNSAPGDYAAGVDEETYMFCPKCGEKIPERAAFCPYCGSKFTRVPGDSAPEMPQHSEETPSYAPLPKPQQSQVLPEGADYILPEPEKPKKPKVAVIILAIAAALLAALAGFLVIAPALLTRSAGSSAAATAQVDAAQPAEEAENTGGTAKAQDETPEDETPVPTATPIPTVTPVPTATPIPTATPTPTEAPQPTINPVSVIDASTGQPISIPNDTATSYAYPDASTRVWSYGDVNGMTAGQVRYCINEIYAKNGYTFARQEWLNYFMQKTWYSPTVPTAAFSDAYLNATEVANVKLLNQYYTDRGFPDY